MEIDLGVQELVMLGDSDLLIRQDQGEWKIRDVKLHPYRQSVKILGKGSGPSSLDTSPFFIMNW